VTDGATDCRDVKVLAIPAQKYQESSKICPEPTVLVGGGDYALVKDTHYKVSYANNKEVGTATATITGLGDWANIKKEVTFARIENCSDCGGSGAEKESDVEKCPECRGTGRVTVRQQTMLGYMQTQRSCQRCAGRGKIIKSPCKNCNGKRRVRLNKKLEVHIPSGTYDRMNIVLRGQGSAGLNGGPNGHLIIEIRVREDKVFRREGNNIYCEVPISFAEATLGAEIDVPMLGGGTEKYRIPEGTQSGTDFTLRGKGIPDINTKRKGDLIITVAVETPRNLNSKQKELLTAFAESLGENNSSKKQSFFKKFFK
jgi:molecular chaperone DnaJ